MMKLIRNENMKLYGRISTWVMLGLLIAIIIFIGVMTKLYSFDTSGTDWKIALTQQNESLKATLSDMPGSQASKNQLSQLIEINEYRIAHDIPPADDTLWGFVSFAAQLISLISLFTIVIGAGMVAGEFSEGTIKLLMIRPSSRWKILLSKYAATLFNTVLMLLLLFIVSLILGGILFGFDNISLPHLIHQDGIVRETSMVGYVFSLYGYYCVELLMMATFAFMISTVFRNSSMAIGLAIFLMFSGTTIVQLLSRYNWVKYILFANTNLQMYSIGTPPVEGMTLGFSIAVLIAYYISFNVISWLSFTKRDIAA